MILKKELRLQLNGTRNIYKMKHIVFFTLSMARGGAEGVIARLCNDYLNKKYKITILTCMNHTVEQQLDDSIEVRMLDEENVQYSGMAQRFFKRRKLLKKELLQLQPDMLISFLPEPNFLAMSLKGKFAFPMIFSVRNDPVREYKNKVYHILMRYFYPKADGAVFQTEDAKQYFSFSKRLSKESVIIPNPLGKEFQNLMPSVNRNKEIVSVGRLDSQKNQGLLLRVFSQIVKKHPEYVLKIYGTGPEKETLQNLINALELSGSVELCGNVPGIRDKIKDSAMFVLCSDYEGMPNALMEALALGIPCVATDCPCGGCRYLIEDGVNGLLVPTSDEDALLGALERLLGNPKEAERMARQSVEDIKRIYPDRVYAKWDAYIEKYI